MNAVLYLFFHNRFSVPFKAGMKHVFDQGVYQILKRNLTLGQTEKLAGEYARSLQNEGIEKADEQLTELLKKQPDHPCYSLADILIVVPVYQLLYQLLWCQIIHPMPDALPGYTPSLMAQALVLYIVFKGLLVMIAQDWLLAKRWAGILGLFALYLLGLRICSRIPDFVRISLPASLIGGSALLILGLKLNMKLFHIRAHEKRVS